MPKFTLQFDLGNAAFDPDPRPEIQRLLHGIADQFPHSQLASVVIDINGNVIGSWAIENWRIENEG